MGLVVCKVRPKVSTASQALLDPSGVALSAVYEKLKGLEPPVCRELVRHTARPLKPVIDQLGGTRPDLWPGSGIPILDGRPLAQTQKRSGELLPGTETVESEVSTSDIAAEVRATSRGMRIAIPVEEGGIFGRLSVPELAEVLRELAGQVHLPAFRRHPRGPKKPRPARTRGQSIKPVSTAKLLAQRKTTKVKP